MNVNTSIPAILAARALDEGGFTYRISDGAYPRAGFAVAVSKGPERTFDRPLTAADIEAFWDDNADIIRAGNLVFKDNVCIGAWRNGDTWYLDLSIVCRSLDEALVLGRANDQLAVYDLGDATSIAIPYHEPPAEVEALVS